MSTGRVGSSPASAALMGLTAGLNLEKISKSQWDNLEKGIKAIGAADKGLATSLAKMLLSKADQGEMGIKGGIPNPKGAAHNAATILLRDLQGSNNGGGGGGGFDHGGGGGGGGGLVR